MAHLYRLLLLTWLSCFWPAAAASSLTVGVAANFKATLEQLIVAHQASHPGLEIRLSVASTGTLYAQIVSGAPFDLMFAADSERPTQLYQQGLSDRPYTYALGRLVLVSRIPGVSNLNDLRNFGGKIAIANPVTAPYGAAAEAILRSLDTERQWPLVKGNNIAQAYQFYHSGNVQVGLIAASLLTPAERSRAFPIPDQLHQPIRQQAVVLKGPNTVLAAAFLDFVISPAGKDIILATGYDVERARP